MEWEQIYSEATLHPTPTPAPDPQLCGDPNAGPPSLQEMTLSSVNCHLLLQQLSLLLPLGCLTGNPFTIICMLRSLSSASSVNGRLEKLHPGNLLSFRKPSLANPEKPTALGTLVFLIPFPDRCRNYFLTPFCELFLCA